jgi:hypothetical protein
VLLLFAAVGSACAAVASAQDQPGDEGGPVVVGSRDRWRSFELVRLDAALESQLRWRRSERKTEGQPDLTDTEKYLLGQIELGGQAYIGHRNLLDVTGAVALGYERVDVESDAIDSDRVDSDVRALYDLSGLILGEGPAPLTVYSRREQTRLEREFAGTIDSINTEHGARMLIRSAVAPTSLHYFHREIDQADQFGDIDFNVVQDTLALRSDVLISEQQDLALEYTFDSVDEQQSRSFENAFQRHDARATHSWDFGPDDRHNLRSMLRYYDESGLVDLRRIRLDETLRLEHTDRFDTRYDLVAEDTQRIDQTQRFFSGRAQGRYRLFESLVATAGGGGSRTEIEDFTSDQVFADALVEYTKRVPYGRFDASVGLVLNLQDDSERGEPLAITDERLTITDTSPLLITRRNVIPDSIIVTDSAGIRLYVEGIDYTVRVFPDRVEIRRVVGGAIVEGETLLVDYTIGPEPASTIETSTATFSTRYTLDEGFLKGLSGFIIYQWVDQSLREGDPASFILEDLHDLRYGADYHIGNFTFSAERQNHDSTTFPYDATRLQARYDLRVGPASALSASLTRDTTEYQLDDDEVEIDRATLRWYGRLGDDIDYNLRLLYRDEGSRFSGDSTGFEQHAEVIWRKGKTTINAALRNTTLESDVTDTLSQEISVGLRRTF